MKSHGSSSTSTGSPTSDENVHHHRNTDYEKLYRKYVKKNNKLKYQLMKWQANVCASKGKSVFTKDCDCPGKPKTGSKKGSKKGSKEGSKKSSKKSSKKLEDELLSETSCM